MVPDNGTESSDEEGEIGRRCKTGKTSQNVRWPKWDPVIYDVAFRGERFISPPLEDKTVYQYLKQFFDDDLIDLLRHQTKLYSVETEERGETIRRTGPMQERKKIKTCKNV